MLVLNYWHWGLMQFHQAALLWILYKKELDRVRGINKAAESDYKQNWRGGEDVGFDGGRLIGNILASYMIPGSQTYLGSGIIGGGLSLLNADENSKR